MAISYCTLLQAATEAEVSTTAGDFETYFTRFYPEATRRIETITRNLFAPRIATRYFDAVKPTYNNGVLFLNYPLVSLTDVSIEGTSQTLADFTLQTYNERPAMEIYSQTGFTGWSNRRRALSVTGIWVERSYYDEAWESVTTLAANIASTTATSVSVDESTSVDSGDMIQVNSEWMSVTNKTGNTLTVARGIHGSTAATHTSADAVSIWRPEYDIQTAAAQIIAYGYTRKGKYDNVQFDAGGSVAVQFPPDLPQTVLNILARYQLGYGAVI